MSLNITYFITFFFKRNSFLVFYYFFNLVHTLFSQIFVIRCLLSTIHYLNRLQLTSILIKLVFLSYHTNIERYVESTVQLINCIMSWSIHIWDYFKDWDSKGKPRKYFGKNTHFGYNIIRRFEKYEPNKITEKETNKRSGKFQVSFYDYQFLIHIL